jgi:hypothetical protein
VKERQLTTNSSEAPVTAAAISPAGKYLAYADPTGVYLRLIDSGELHTLTTRKNLSLTKLAWFPDGAKILVSAIPAGGQAPSIWVISILGGTPRKLRDNAGDASAFPDGLQIAFITGDGKEIWVMGANGENPQKVLSGPLGDIFEGVQCLRDRSRLGYGRVHPAGDRFDLTVESLDRKTEHVAVALSDPKITAGVALPDGRMIYSRMEQPYSASANLWEIRINPTTGRATGKPRRITNWTGVNISGLSVTADGKHLAFQKGLAESDVYIGELQASGTRLVDPHLRLTHGRENWADAGLYAHFGNHPLRRIQSQTRPFGQPGYPPLDAVSGPARSYLALHLTLQPHPVPRQLGFHRRHGAPGTLSPSGTKFRGQLASYHLPAHQPFGVLEVMLAPQSRMNLTSPTDR